jgi:hypothetical protein
VVAHGRATERVEELDTAVGFYDRGLQRIDGAWAGTGNQSTDLASPDHPYAVDLDLFGKGSLFELLCTTHTGIGERRLANWLLEPASPHEVKKRQSAVEELEPNLTLRESVAVSGAGTPTVAADELSRWGEGKAVFGSPMARALRFVAVVLGTAMVLMLIAWRLDRVGPVGVVGAFAANLIFLGVVRKSTNRVLSGLSKASGELSVLVTLLRHLEQSAFESPKLEELRQQLVVDSITASVAVGRLRRLTSWVESRDNMLFGLVSILLVLPVHFALSAEKWRARFGKGVRRWVDDAGELEALCALAAYAYEHPGDIFPELVQRGDEEEEECLLDARSIGHPLLDPRKCVTNDVTIDSPVRAWIVSGSNMSGKTTLLKAVGVNAVLAMAGGKVRAESFRIRPVQVGATIHIEGSLQAGRSRFYAEVRRLKQLMDLASGDLTLLFLLDEVLHGTNSNDRRAGAIALLERFFEKSAFGLVTTHDLGVAEGAGKLGDRVLNHHFIDHVEDGKLSFDYKLRQGVVPRGNALQLMREVGLPV